MGVSIRYNQEGDPLVVVWFKHRSKLWIFRRTLEHLLPLVIMGQSMYGIRLAKIQEISWRINQSQNLELILREVTVYTPRYLQIADIYVQQDRMDRQGYLIPPLGKCHIIYRPIRNGCGMVSITDNFDYCHVIFKFISWKLDACKNEVVGPISQPFCPHDCLANHFILQLLFALTRVT